MRATIVSSFVGLAYLFCAGSSARAELIPVGLVDAPDILVQAVGVEYDFDAQVLSISGIAVQIDDDGLGAAEGITGGEITMSVPVDHSGILIDNTGTLLVEGEVSSLGFTSGTLLTATITDFGFSDPEGGISIQDFRFDITGGDASGLYGSQAAMILSQITQFTNWESDWDNFEFLTTGFAVGDIGVPEPSSWVLLFIGALALAAWRRRAFAQRRNEMPL